MKLYIILLFAIPFLLNLSLAYGEDLVIDQLASLNDSNVGEMATKRNKSTILEKFLEKQRSPLAPYAQVIVSESYKNNLDYRLLPAITGVESSFGKAIPANSYNAYGWNNGKYSFTSWEDGIETVSVSLYEKYSLKWGAETPHEIGKYYAASPTWADRVVNYMEQINDNILITADNLPVNL